jgi:transposase
VEPGFRWIEHPAAISPVWLEMPERIAVLAMLTVVGLLVYTLIRRQVRSYLRDHTQPLPGTKGPTATPTAAVVFALFALVTLVQFAGAQQRNLQVHGWQEHHRTVCDAFGIDSGWYTLSTTWQNALECFIPPCTWGIHYD